MNASDFTEKAAAMRGSTPSLFCSLSHPFPSFSASRSYSFMCTIAWLQYTCAYIQTRSLLLSSFARFNLDEYTAGDCLQVNTIAAAIKDEFPDIAVDTLAYQWSRSVEDCYLRSISLNIEKQCCNPLNSAIAMMTCARTLAQYDGVIVACAFLLEKACAKDYQTVAVGHHTTLLHRVQLWGAFDRRTK